MPRASERAFPARIEELSCAWLNRVLFGSGTGPDAPMAGFGVAPVNGGFTSSLFRVTPRYRETVDGAPQALIVKMHGNCTDTRALFEPLGIYEKEVRFYRELARDDSLPVPVCYAAEYDPASGDFILLLEDLSAARPGSYDHHAPDDVRTALTHLAALHAGFWGRPLLREQDWIADLTSPEKPSPDRALWARNFERVSSDHRERMSDKAWRACRKWRDHWDALMLCMSQDTHTLIHTDPHLGQMMFPSAQFPRFVLFDWQYPSRGWAARDVTHLLISALDRDVRRQHEETLLGHYFDCLRGRGVADLSRERFRFQCRLALLWYCFMEFNVVANPQLLESMRVEAEAQGQDWRDWIFPGLDAAISDWDLDGAVDQAIEEARAL